MPKKKASAPAVGAKITQAEWEVMRILWDANKPLPAAEVAARLEGKWSPKTVRSFLNRLVQKQSLKAVKQGFSSYELIHYVPLIDEVSALRVKQETFAQKFFGGTVQSMLAGCIQSGEISTEELLQLRAMIDRQVDDQKKQKGGVS
jgi:BlaI family penicillinase repressor